MAAGTHARRTSPLVALILIASLAAIAGGIIGAAAYALLLDDDPADERGAVIHFGSADRLYDIENNPFCVPAQHLCLVLLDSGEVRALYTYDTHDWFREQSCELTWRPDMLFTDPDTQVESQGWFRSGCSGTTYRYTGERVFGPGGRDMDQFPVEAKTSIEQAGGDTITVEYLEVDTRQLICGAVANPTVPPGCERAPSPE